MLDDLKELVAKLAVVIDEIDPDTLVGLNKITALNDLIRGKTMELSMQRRSMVERNKTESIADAVKQDEDRYMKITVSKLNTVNGNNRSYMQINKRNGKGSKPHHTYAHPQRTKGLK